MITAAVPHAATSANLATSGHGTALISTFQPKDLANSTRDLVVTLLRIEEDSGTTKVVPLVSLDKATKLEVLNSSMWVRVLESRWRVMGYPAAFASEEYLNTGA